MVMRIFGFSAWTALFAIGVHTGCGESVAAREIRNPEQLERNGFIVTDLEDESRIYRRLKSGDSKLSKKQGKYKSSTSSGEERTPAQPAAPARSEDESPAPSPAAPHYTPTGSKKSKGKESKKSKKTKPPTTKSKLSKKHSKKGPGSVAPTRPPSHTPYPSRPPNGEPSAPPPTPIPPTEAPATPPIAGPPTEGPIVRQLSPYGLLYTTIENDRIPFRSEYLELVELTRSYLQGFMEEEFKDMELTEFEEFSTIFVGSNFDFGEPILVDYDSSAFFKASSAVVPTVDMLDRTVSSAFEGENLNGYIGILQALPPQNVFSSTIFVNQTEPGTGMAGFDDSPAVFTTRTRRAEHTTATFATLGAAAVLLIATSFVLRRRVESKEYNYLDSEADPQGAMGKFLDERSTIAGDTDAESTVAAETSASTISHQQHSSEKRESAGISVSEPHWSLEPNQTSSGEFKLEESGFIPFKDQIFGLSDLEKLAFRWTGAQTQSCNPTEDTEVEDE